MDFFPFNSFFEIPNLENQDHQVRDNLETYLLSKATWGQRMSTFGNTVSETPKFRLVGWFRQDRAGVVRVGNRDMYLIPPAKVKASDQHRFWCDII